MIQKYCLSFISDEDLFHHVRETVQKYRFDMDLASLNQNILDPIKLSFDAGVYERGFSNDDLARVLNHEVWRQWDKSNTNHIGYFHQNIFRYIGKNDGWIVPKNGFDIENQCLNIFVEMKNKHNTMNSSSAARTYLRMQNQCLRDTNSMCLLVEIIAKRSQSVPWKCKIDGEIMYCERIRRESIDYFYKRVTGYPNAFADLCSVLPRVIHDTVMQESENLMKNTVLADLGNRHEANDILKNLYLLAFEKYQGFATFDWRK